MKKIIILKRIHCFKKNHFVNVEIDPRLQYVCLLALHTTNPKNILETKKHLKYEFKHLNIEWNLKKPLVFLHLHKTKGGQYQFEEQSKIMKGVKEQRSKSSGTKREPRVNNKEP